MRKPGSVPLGLAHGSYLLVGGWERLAAGERVAQYAGDPNEVNLLHVFQRLDLRRFLQLLCACMHEHHPGLTPTAVARLLAPSELATAFDAVMRALELAEPGCTSELWRR